MLPFHSSDDFARQSALHRARIARLKRRPALEVLEVRSMLTTLWTFDSGFTYPANSQPSGHVVHNTTFNENAEIHAVALDSNGKILVGGFIDHPDTGSGNKDFFLARLTTTGRLDTTFGGGDGWLQYDFSSNDNDAGTDFSGIQDSTTSDKIESIEAIATQTINGEERIVVAGRAWPNFFTGANSSFALLRFHSDGQVETEFGSNGDGRVAARFASTCEGMGETPEYWRANAARALEIQSSGNMIVVGGWARESVSSNSAPEFAIARFNSDGDPDSTFGVSVPCSQETGYGSNHIPVRDWSEGFDLKLGSGNIFMSGFTRPTGSGDDADFAVIKLKNNGTGDGTIDTTFASSGKKVVDFNSGDDVARALILQGTGVVVGGSAYMGTTTGVDFALLRLDSSGNLDTAWGNQTSTNGKSIIDFTNTASGGDDIGRSLAAQSNGKIVIGGYTHPTGGAPDHFSGARLDSNGAWDTSAGVVLWSSFSNTAGARGFELKVQSDDKVVLGGYYTPTSGDTGIGAIRLCSDPSQTCGSGAAPNGHFGHHTLDENTMRAIVGMPPTFASHRIPTAIQELGVIPREVPNLPLEPSVAPSATDVPNARIPRLARRPELPLHEFPLNDDPLAWD